jgi:hypothetical protein
VLGSEKEYAEEQLRERGKLAEDADADSALSGSLSTSRDFDLADLRLRLGHDGRGVDLPLVESGKSEWLKPPRVIQAPAATPAAQDETVYPDLDAEAGKAPNPKQGKISWAKFQSEVEASGKEPHTNGDTSAELSASSGAPSDEGEMDPPVSDQIPNFDGTEEIDPDSPDAAPIVISTQRDESAKRDVSIYNMDQKN